MKTVDKYHQLLILETLECNPEITQADLASRVGIAVGTVNWYLKQWSKKGWIKIKRIGRWRWQYLLTARGMAEKARLAKKYLEHSMRIYNQIRNQSGIHKTCEGALKWDNRRRQKNLSTLPDSFLK